jgi:antitoxin (DNA-binding transcriptional repressor) of toxin-antitoxin stability system
VKTVPAGEFKTHCLSILDDVFRRKEVVIVTKHKKPVAKITPYQSASVSEPNPLKDSITFEKDIVSPISDTWDALK